MKDLNEKLAEVCGLVLTDNGRVYRHENPIFDGHHHILVEAWNPVGDFNQFHMCWDSLNDRQKKRLVTIMEQRDMTPADLFTRPEDVAHTILKAKGVG